MEYSRTCSFPFIFWPWDRVPILPHTLCITLGNGNRSKLGLCSHLPWIQCSSSYRPMVLTKGESTGFTVSLACHNEVPQTNQCTQQWLISLECWKPRIKVSLSKFQREDVQSILACKNLRLCQLCPYLFTVCHGWLTQRPAFSSHRPVSVVLRNNQHPAPPQEFWRFF